MAIDAPGSQSQSQPAAPAKLPPGIVLDKDGKPCRSCSSKASFSQWAQQTKSSLKAGMGAAVAATTSHQVPADDCPPDVEALGRSTWTLLHTIAANYPTSASHREQADLKTFMGAFSRLYPCWVCAEDFRTYMEKEQIRVGGRNEFGTWLCEAHNAVNTKLGKPVFDCSRWEERWRTGWKDGRCD